MAASPHPGLYLHVPFCRGKCPYCDFYSVPAPPRLTEYRAGLAREYLREVPAFEMPFDTVYLGGGTPSCLPPGDLEALLGWIRESVPLAPDTEWTVEANPADLDPRGCDMLSAAGVNRLSLGAQSFDDRELVLLGRRHTAAEARASIECVRQSGAFALGLDLIHSLPGQRWENFAPSLEEAIAQQPEHLSCYALTLAPGTSLADRVARGELSAPDDAAAAEIFLRTADRLEAAGYEHYEVSNFARGRAQRSRHNGKYWARVPVLGLGPAAHSFDGQRRWWNPRSLERWLAALESGAAPREGDEEPSAEQVRLEILSLGLRTAEGIGRESLGGSPQTLATLSSLVAEKLILLDGDRVRPTGRGLLFADALARRLA